MTVVRHMTEHKGGPGLPIPLYAPGRPAGVAPTSGRYAADVLPAIPANRHTNQPPIGPRTSKASPAVTTSRRKVDTSPSGSLSTLSSISAEPSGALATEYYGSGVRTVSVHVNPAGGEYTYEEAVGPPPFTVYQFDATGTNIDVISEPANVRPDHTWTTYALHSDGTIR
jgi:hypothetical protein